MGIVETVGAVAVALTAIISLGIKIWRDKRAMTLQEKANILNELSNKIQSAKSDEERIKYAKERQDILNS